MIKYTLTLAALCLVFHLDAQVCNPFSFSSQAEIDQFFINNPSCIQIENDLIVQGQDISNLQGLKNIRIIKGILTINNTSINNLNDLSNLESTRGLVLTNNNNITDVSGLISFIISSGSINFKSNSLIDSINLPALKSAKGLYFEDNKALNGISFKNLERIGGKCTIKNETALNTIVFSKLGTVDGDVEIVNVKKLNYLDFQNLDSIVGALIINAETLNTFELPKLKYQKLDMNFNALASCTKISIPNLINYQGTLNISLSSLLSFEMKSLESISGNCSIFFNKNLNLLNLTSLKSVGGSINISDNAVLTSIAFNQLKNPFSSLKIENNAKLNNIEMLKIDSIKSEINISKNGNLNNIMLNNLKYTGKFLFNSNKGSFSINLSSLKTVNQYFTLTYNAGFNSLRLDSLQKSLVIYIYGNTTLKYLDMPSLKRVDNIEIFSNANLKIIDIALDSVKENFSIYNNPTLDSITVKNLMKVGFNFVIQSNELLGYTDFGKLTDVNNDALITFPKMGLFNFSNLKIVKNNFEFNCFDKYEFTSLESVGKMSIKATNTMTQISFPKLNFINHLELNLNKSLKHIYMPSIDTVNIIYVYQNDSLMEIDFPVVKANSIQISYNTSLKNIKLDYLNGASIIVDNNKVLNDISMQSMLQSSWISIENNLQLTFLEIEKIEVIKGSFTCSSNAMLTQISVPVLTQIDGELKILNNSKLTNIDFPKVKSITSVEIGANTVLSILKFPELQNISSIRVSANAKLISIIADKVVKTSLTIERNDILKNVSLLNLSELSSLMVLYNRGLINIDFGLLETVTSNIYIYSNDSLNSINLPILLKCQGGLFVMGKNFTKLRLPILEEIGEGLLIAESNVDSLIMSNLKKVGGGISLIKLFKLTEISMPKLNSVGNTIRVDLCIKLVSMKGISSFSIDQFTNTNWWISITNNLSLSYCNVPFLCQAAISFPSQIEIYNNAPGCRLVSELSCDDLLISGKIFYDNNINGIQDTNEFSVPNAKVMDEENNITYYCDKNGVFKFVGLENAKYKLTPMLPENMTISSTPPVYELVYNAGQGIYDTFDFGVHYKNDFKKLEVNVANDLMRCNTETTIVVSCQNSGSKTTNGFLEVHLDDIITYVSSSLPPLKIQGNIIEWKIDSLDPFELNEIVITIKAPSEMFTGNIVSIDAIFYGDAEHKNELNRSSIDKEVRCSFDPNDKAVSPFAGMGDNPTLLKTPLQYTIRFQNTGNDVAYNIEIRDTLDSNLDLSTFKVIKSSFPVNTSMYDHAVSFNFNDINLPSEKQDEPASHGYVIYSISPKSDLSVTTQIFNRAGIYFDFNPPIFTNQVVNTMIETATDDIEIANDCHLQPNISSHEICIVNRNPSFRPVKIGVYNANGIYIKDVHDDCLNISDFSSGLYFIKLHDHKKSETLKFVKN